MTFKEIEQIIHGGLPPSAWEYRPWWSNNKSNTAARNGWLNAGWETTQVDMAKGELIFICSDSKIKSISEESQLESLIHHVGGKENLVAILESIERYIAGEIVEIELGRIMRQIWSRI